MAEIVGLCQPGDPLPHRAPWIGSKLRDLIDRPAHQLELAVDRYHPIESPQLVALEVRKYKNLRDVWLPWDEGMALFGRNGSGKTNLLECLTLLLGSGQSVGLAGPRLATPEPGDLSLLARPGYGSLPWPPDLVARWDREIPSELVEEIPALGRATADAKWWRLLGDDGGATFLDGMSRVGLPARVLDFMTELVQQPVVCYRLARIERVPSSVIGADEVTRQFTRTLMARSVPTSALEAADHLPELFGPLRSHLAAPAETLGDWIPVLELPQTDTPPATLQWLPRGRSADELNSDLEVAFTTAGGYVAELTASLGERLPFLIPLEERDWNWLSHEIGANRAQEELALILPDVEIVASGGGDADFALIGGGDERSHTGDEDVLEYFSSGERRWIDEALATAARELTRFGQLARLYASSFVELDDDTVMSAISEVAERVDEELKVGDYWNGEAFEQLLHALEPVLIAAASAYSKAEDPLAEEIQRNLKPGLSLLQPQVVIRIFDEPEAHLHPAAQRTVATALRRLQARGQNVVIASHSPHFLDLPTWSLVHVQRSAGGTIVRSLPAESGNARTTLAKQLGINRGELLAGINGLLIVEGMHDKLILERLFGAELRAAGLAVLRMFGTDNLLATAELDFLDLYLDVPVIVLVDNARVNRIVHGKPQTDEEKKLYRLKRRSRSRGRPMELIGLERPDIVCYLSDASLRAIHPGFPGWSAILTAFSRLQFRPKFKEWLRDRFGVDITHSGRIDTILDHMESAHNQAVGELTLKMNEILSHLPTPPVE